MIPDRHILDLLLRAVALRFGCVPKTPADFNLLSSDVYHRTGRTIGVSTLKRLWGYIRCDHGVTFSTLSLLARYAGYADWDAFCARVRPGGRPLSDSDFVLPDAVSCADMSVGETLDVFWGTDKSCRLEKMAEPDLFRVAGSSGIKLREGDVGRLKSVCVGLPLVVHQCRRGPALLNTYVASGPVSTISRGR